MITFTFSTYIIIGLIAISLIDTAGSVASGKLNFNYMYLSVLSTATYVSIAYFASKDYNLTTVLLLTSILGLYDGTVGLWFSKVLKANTGKTPQGSNEIGIRSAITMIMMSLIFGLAGYGLSLI